MSQPDPFSQADDFFASGNPSISFKDTRGVWKGGTITRIGEKQQQKDYKTKLPEFWDDAKTQPKWVLPIDVQTDERNPLDPHDDGMRTLWVSGGVQRAIGAALKTTRAKLRPGGTLHVMWSTGAGEDGDPKQYEANYTPPVPGAAAADSMFAPAAAPQPPAAAGWPTPTAAPPATPGWGQPAPPAAQTWVQPQAVAPQQQTPPPAAAPPAPPAAPVLAAAPVLDIAAIEAAYSHLEPPQRAAIAAAMGQGMTIEQVAAIFGPPQGAAA